MARPKFPSANRWNDRRPGKKQRAACNYLADSGVRGCRLKREIWIADDDVDRRQAVEFRQSVARECSAGVATVGCGRASSDGHDGDDRYERETRKAWEARPASAAPAAAGLQL